MSITPLIYHLITLLSLAYFSKSNPGLHVDSGLKINSIKNAPNGAFFYVNSYDQNFEFSAEIIESGAVGSWSAIIIRASSTFLYEPLSIFPNHLLN